MSGAGTYAAAPDGQAAQENSRKAPKVSARSVRVWSWAYEYLIKYFADSAGKKGGQFYTPSQVVQLLVNLIKPAQGMSVYDPTVGSGGMLIQSSQYAEEQGDDGGDLVLCGQENDGAVVSIAKMNLILHNLFTTFVEYGDTLEEPLHVHAGTLRPFDRVIASPSFSQNYTLSKCQRNERFPYGFAPGRLFVDRGVGAG